MAGGKFYRTKNATLDSLPVKRQVKNLKKRVNKIYGLIEKKFLFDNVALANSTSTSTLTLINGIAIGDDYINRSGKSIDIDKIQIQGNFHSSSITDPTTEVYEANAFRVLVVYDRQPNGSAITAAVIFNNVAYAWMDTYKENAKSRFRILADKRFTSSPPDVKKFTISKKYKKPLRTSYLGTGSAITDIETGSIYVLTVSDSASSPHPQVEYSWKIRFYDL